MGMVQQFQFTVVGAGPSGIAVVDKLLAAGFQPSDILWIDTEFSVGDFAKYWSNVSGNTKVGLFCDFLKALPSFQSITETFPLFSFEREDTCDLKHMVAPLQAITQKLTKKLTCIHGCVLSLQRQSSTWEIETTEGRFVSRGVVLTQGAKPISLEKTYGVPAIPMTVALDKEKLQGAIDLASEYAVFGSSHSAIIVLKHLCDLGVKRVINFYKTPCRYALSTNYGTLFDNTGLKGKSAQWAKAHIDGNWPHNLERFPLSDVHIKAELPKAKQAVYAVGFERRNDIVCHDTDLSQYDAHTGIIALGLFGFGIAYPEKHISPWGHTEWQVGLWKFMQYLEKILPLWLEYLP